MLKQQQRCGHGMEERCQLANDPSYIGGKEWGVRTKVVIDWNTLNDVECPLSWNQSVLSLKAQLLECNEPAPLLCVVADLRKCEIETYIIVFKSI